MMVINAEISRKHRHYDWVYNGQRLTACRGRGSGTKNPWNIFLVPRWFFVSLKKPLGFLKGNKKQRLKPQSSS